MAFIISNTASFTFTLPRALTIATTSLFNTSLRFLSSTSNLLPPYIYKYKYNARHKFTLGVGVSNFSTVHFIEKEEEENSKKDGDVVTRSPHLVALEYADLKLPLHCQEVGNIRVRQHVNPLRSSLSVPAEPPDWNVVYKDSSLPLMVDIGCGSGRFLLWLAKMKSDSCNYLGLEIRKKLVQRANFWVKDLDLLNTHFIFANATISFQQLVSSYPGPLKFVSILCPDPHFKKRHHKRRVLQKPLVDSIVNNLGSGGQVFVQSDVLEVAVDMRNQFDGVSDMTHIDMIDPNFGCDSDGWLLSNPMGIRTEREIHAEFEGAKIYRRLYQKHT